MLMQIFKKRKRYETKLMISWKLADLDKNFCKLLQQLDYHVLSV